MAGVITSAKDRFITLIKNCDAWWDTWCGLADVAAGLERIHEVEKEEDKSVTGTAKNDLRPRMFVAVELGGEVGGSGVFGGKARAKIEAAVAAEHQDDPEAAFEAFEDNLGLLIAEMLTDAKADAAGTKLNVLRFEGEIDGPVRCDRDRWETDGDHITAVVTFEYGPTGVS